MIYDTLYMIGHGMMRYYRNTEHMQFAGLTNRWPTVSEAGPSAHYSGVLAPAAILVLEFSTRKLCLSAFEPWQLGPIQVSDECRGDVLGLYGAVQLTCLIGS